MIFNAAAAPGKVPVLENVIKLQLVPGPMTLFEHKYTLPVTSFMYQSPSVQLPVGLVVPLV